MKVKFFSPSTGGFYAEDIHGPRMMDDPGFVQPPGGPEVQPPRIPNPSCLMPQDVVEVPDDEHEALMAAQSLGKMIVADQGGRPVAQTVVIAWSTLRDQVLRQVRVERAPILQVLDGLQSTASAKGLQALIGLASVDGHTAAEWSAKAVLIEGLKQLLKNAPAAVDLTQLTTYAQMRDAFKAYYAAGVAGAPLDIKLAYKEIVE